MSKDKAEEKAREYAGITPDVKDISQLPLYFYVQRQKYKDYLAGYTQAVTDLSTENAQLREALREILDTQFNSDMSHFNAMQKAKQLLTDKE